MDDVFIATLLSTLRELARSPGLQGTQERLELERMLAACLLEEALVALHPLERVSALAVTAVELVREARLLVARL